MGPMLARRSPLVPRSGGQSSSTQRRSPAAAGVALLVVSCASRWTGPEPGYSRGTPGGVPPRAAAPAVVATGAAGERAAPPRGAGPAPPPEAVTSGAVPPAEGPFPAGTRSLLVREQTHVWSAPSHASRYVGKLVRGSRVSWKRTATREEVERAHHVVGRGRRDAACPAWVEIEPSGWLCSSVVTPSNEEARAIPQPVVAPGRLTPDDYYRVNADETKVYASEEDVAAGVVKRVLSTKVMVVGLGQRDVGGTDYTKTDHGLVESASLSRYWPSDFEGADLVRPGAPALPFAWAWAPRGARGPSVSSAPGKEGAPVRRAARREIVPVIDERDGFVRIGDDQWIERRHLRVATRTAPPPGVGASEQWIDVDLDEQVLVAYEGERPVFATLVSTGKKRHPTPPGTYRVRAKAATTTMADDPSVPDRYEVSAVPWAVRFRSGLFIHAVYWHDGFGSVLSHGCVNVSPRDAARIYAWVAPLVPDGWSEAEVPPGEGTVVRLRDREHPDPPPYDYSAEEARP